MAKLKALPHTDIIDGFKGVIDFYVNYQTTDPELRGKGVPCARRWPRSPGKRRAAAVEAQWLAFTFAAQSWAFLSPEIQQAYRDTAQHTHMSGRDLYVKSFLSTYFRDGQWEVEEEEEMAIIWKDDTPLVINLLNQNANKPWTEVDLLADTSATATMALLHVKIKVDSRTLPNWVDFNARKKGTAPAVTRMFQIKSEIGPFAAWAEMEQQVWVGLDADQKIEYKTEKGGNPLQWDIIAHLLAYVQP